jgi:hypothetical protein
MAEEPLTPCVVIMAGLPGTGKSTIANAAASEVEGIVFDKDRVRTALFSDPWIEYSRQQDDFVIDLLLQSADWLLVRPHVPPFIFFDGRVFVAREQIEHVVNWPGNSGCAVTIIHTICSDATAFERLRSAHHPARNRNYELYLELKSRFDPIERPHLTLDTDRSNRSFRRVCPTCGTPLTIWWASPINKVEGRSRTGITLHPDRSLSAFRLAGTQTPDREIVMPVSIDANKAVQLWVFLNEDLGCRYRFALQK